MQLEPELTFTREEHEAIRTYLQHQLVIMRKMPKNHTYDVMWAPAIGVVEFWLSIHDITVKPKSQKQQ